MSFCIKRFFQNKGQATLETAFLIPVIFLLMLMLIQPGIILYNQMIMQAAASEGCRLLTTRSAGAVGSYEKYESYVLRRLGSIPPQDNFHVHQSACSWEIELIGDETSDEVQVKIKNELKLLPFFDSMGNLLGLSNGNGNFVQEVSVSSLAQPAWVQASELGLNPSAWIEEDLS